MPVLSNPRHELFAQELAKGKTATEACDVSGVVLTPCRGLARYYVYLLIDPRDDKVFYVGKGKGARYAAHVKEWFKGVINNPLKYERIGQIRDDGFAVSEVCFQSDLEEWQSLDLEKELIEGIGRSILTNFCSGKYSPETKGHIEAMDCLARIIPYCRMKMENRPRHKGDLSAEQAELAYWDIVGGFNDVIALHEGRKYRRYERLSFSKYFNNLPVQTNAIQEG